MIPFHLWANAERFQFGSLTCAVDWLTEVFCCELSGPLCNWLLEYAVVCVKCVGNVGTNHCWGLFLSLNWFWCGTNQRWTLRRRLGNHRPRAQTVCLYVSPVEASCVHSRRCPTHSRRQASCLMRRLHTHTLWTWFIRCYSALAGFWRKRGNSSSCDPSFLVPRWLTLFGLLSEKWWNWNRRMWHNSVKNNKKKHS